MRILKKPNTQIEKIWGNQTIQNVSYRKLKYILETEINGEVILYNVVTGIMVCLDPEEKQVYKNLPLPYSCRMDQLIRSHFLVPESYDEKMAVQHLRKMMKLVLTKKDITGYVILPTTNCNARCFYCYENGYKHINMTPTVARDLVSYMIEHCGGNKLHLQWFGGEPLVGEGIIDKICEDLSASNVQFNSTMTSNGFLFNEELVKKAKDQWALKRVQITLDGTETVYNDTKAYKNVSENPYVKVLNNIRLLLDNGIRVVVRLNLGRHNYEDLIALINELSQKFKGYSNFDVYVRVLYNNVGFEPVLRNEQEDDELNRRRIELHRYINDVGLGHDGSDLPILSLNSCMAEKDSSLVVYPDGRFFKCEHIEDQDQVGSIYGKELDKTVLERFKKKYELPECGACPLYPSCIMLEKCDSLADHNRFSCAYDLQNAVHSLTYKYMQIK